MPARMLRIRGSTTAACQDYDTDAPETRKGTDGAFMTVFIHIGMQKTGTTFLQIALHNNREALSQKGLTYPFSPTGLAGKNVRAHHFIPHAILGRHSAHLPDADFSLLEQHVDELKNIISDSGNIGIISSEDFSSLDKDEVFELRKLFPERDTRIIVYLRRQDYWADSLYGQMLKGGRQKSLSDFMKKIERKLDYRALLEPWSDAFGRENIVVRRYEKLEGRSLWDDFMDATGCQQAKTVDPGLETANSLSYEAVMFLKALGPYGPQREIRRILSKNEKRYAPTFRGAGLRYLPAHLAREIISLHKESNEHVAKQYLKKGTLFADDSPPVVIEDGLVTVEDYIQIMGGILVELLDRVNTLEKTILKNKEK